MDTCFSPCQLEALAMLEAKTPTQQGCQRVRAHVAVILNLFYCVPVAKRAHRDTMLEGDLTDVARGAMERFGPLKVVLGTIPAIYANHKVHQQAPSWNRFLTNSFIGNHHYRK